MCVDILDFFRVASLNHYGSIVADMVQLSDINSVHDIPDHLWALLEEHNLTIRWQPRPHTVICYWCFQPQNGPL